MPPASPPRGKLPIEPLGGRSRRRRPRAARAVALGAFRTRDRQRYPTDRIPSADFTLQSLRFATPLFLPEALYSVASHEASAGLGASCTLAQERAQVLRRFFESTQGGDLRLGVPSRRFDRGYFHDFVRARGYQSFVATSPDPPISRYWYPDGWAPPNLRFRTIRGGTLLRLRGRLPVYYPKLLGQSLSIFIDGRPAGSYPLRPGDFEIRLATESRAAMVTIEFRATRWLVPKYDLDGSDDARSLAYLLDDVEWETATAPLEPDDSLRGTHP
jgi:hypothetical protein